MDNVNVKWMHKFWFYLVKDTLIWKWSILTDWLAPNNISLQVRLYATPSVTIANVFWTWQQSEKEAGFSLYSQQDGDEYIGSDLLPAQTVFSLDFHAKQTLAADKTELKQRRY